MRIIRWILLGILASGVALVAASLWYEHHREAKFSSLPPGERQLVIFDAFAAAVEAHYIDRDFIAGPWPAMRDEWRRKAAATRDYVSVYFDVLARLQQKFPSSHVSALAPHELFEKAGRQDARRSAAQAALTDRGFQVALVRRGAQVRPFVADVNPNSPAADAGIEPGWPVFDLPDGNSAVETGVFCAVGTPQERLAFEALRNWPPARDDWKTNAASFAAEGLRRIEFRHMPAAGQIPIESSRKLGAGVTYIMLGSFEYPIAVDKVLEAIDQAANPGVVLDLRTNGGGFSIQELRLADRLLAADLPVETQIEAQSTVTYRTKAGKKYSGPLTVLIGPATGSAAEVVAAALQDHHRALLIGRSTAGQVLTARSWPLPGGGEVEVAFVDVRRMNGQRIEGVGVMPDIPVMPTNAEVRAGRDSTLERALLELARVASASSGSPPRRE